jgi:class 3 adenylate cyclase
MSGAVNGGEARVESRRVIMVADLAGFSRAVGPLSTVEVTELVHRFYAAAAALVESHGGRVVKFVGDGCLAIFPEDVAPVAVACAVDFADIAHELSEAFGVALDVGANVHLAMVVEGSFGVGASAAFDVMGVGVLHAFRMGAGPGVRISEPVYRKLPNDQRRGWRKHQPPATYVREGAA